MSGLREFNFTKRQWRAVFAYLFQESNLREFRNNFDSGIAAKRLIDSSGYVLLNCKLFVAANSTGGGVDPTEYGIHPKDARFLRTIKVDCRGYKAWELEHFKHVVEEQLFCKDMENYIGKFISKKLIFLRSYGHTRSDLETELHIAALYAVYRGYPFYESVLHLQNTAKTAIKNRGHDLIITSTRMKNQSLRRLSDGTFESLVVPYHLAGLEDKPYAEDNGKAYYYTQLAKAYNKGSGRVKQYITLILGEYDVEFSSYLGKSNAELYKRWPTEDYMSGVREYMDLSAGQCQRFFDKLKRL